MLDFHGITHSLYRMFLFFATVFFETYESLITFYIQQPSFLLSNALRFFFQFIQSSQNIRNDSISKNGKILATSHATFSEPRERETHKVLKIESSHVSFLWFSHRTVKNRIVQNYVLFMHKFLLQGGIMTSQPQ